MSCRRFWYFTEEIWGKENVDVSQLVAKQLLNEQTEGET